MNSKGNAFLDGITYTAGGLLLAITIIIIALITNGFSDALQQEDDVPQEIKTFSSTNTAYLIVVLDNMFFAFMVLSWMLAVVLSFQVNTSPIFLWLTFGLIIITIIFAVLIVSLYGDFATVDGISQFIVDFPKLHFVMSNLVKIVVCFCFTVLIAQFGKQVLNG